MNRKIMYPKLNWKKFNENDLPIDDVHFGEKCLIFFRMKYECEDKCDYVIDIAESYGDYLGNFWTTENDWNEGQEIEVLAYAKFGYVDESDIINIFDKC